MLSFFYVVLKLLLSLYLPGRRRLDSFDLTLLSLVPTYGVRSAGDTIALWAYGGARKPSFSFTSLLLSSLIAFAFLKNKVFGSQIAFALRNSQFLIHRIPLYVSQFVCPHPFSPYVPCMSLVCPTPGLRVPNPPGHTKHPPRPILAIHVSPNPQYTPGPPY